MEIFIDYNTEDSKLLTTFIKYFNYKPENLSELNKQSNENYDINILKIPDESEKTYETFFGILTNKMNSTKYIGLLKLENSNKDFIELNNNDLNMLCNYLKKHEKGILINQNNSYYIGEYIDDRKHGFGVYHFESDGIYIGSYDSDVIGLLIHMRGFEKVSSCCPHTIG